MNEEENLEKHILEYEDLLRKLKATGAEVKDDDKICNLLISLPKSYDTVVVILENTKGIKYTQVKSKLLFKFDKRKVTNKELKSYPQKLFNGWRR